MSKLETLKTPSIHVFQLDEVQSYPVTVLPIYTSKNEDCNPKERIMDFLISKKHYCLINLFYTFVETNIRNYMCRNC